MILLPVLDIGHYYYKNYYYICTYVRDTASVIVIIEYEQHYLIQYSRQIGSLRICMRRRTHNSSRSDIGVCIHSHATQPISSLYSSYSFRSIFMRASIDRF